MTYGDQVRALVGRYDRETKAMFGGPPFSASIDHNIAQFSRFLREGLPKRQRFAIGKVSLDGGIVTGYWEATVLCDANPSGDERELLDLSGPLNYFHCKKLIVAPELRGTGLARRLMDERVAIAERLGKPMVADVRADNLRIINFLSDYGFDRFYSWENRAGTAMLRLERAR